MCIDTSVDV